MKGRRGTKPGWDRLGVLVKGVRLLTFLGRGGYGGWGAATIVLCLAVSGCQGPQSSRVATEPVKEAGIDQRIAFYQKKVGGPATYPAYARLGMAYAQKARETGNADFYEEAKRCFLKSLGYQRNYEALLGAAIAFSERHQFREALGYAEEAVQTMPSDVDARGILFDTQLALGQVDKAERIVTRMVEELPGFASYTRLTAFRAYKGDLPGAIASMEKAVAAAEGRKLPAGTRAWAEVRLGSLLVEHCQAEQGRAAYGRALAIVPNYYFALEHIAELEAAQGRIQEAAGIYEKLLRTLPDPNYRVALAELYDALGQAQKAREQRALAAADWQKKIAAGAQSEFRPYAMLLWDENKTAEALQLAQKDWAIRQDTFAADTLAYAHFRNGHLPEARRFMEQALGSGARETGVLLHAAEIFSAVGETDRARTLLEEVGRCPQVIGPGNKLALSRLGAALKRS